MAYYLVVKEGPTKDVIRCCTAAPFPYKLALQKHDVVKLPMLFADLEYSVYLLAVVDSSDEAEKLAVESGYKDFVKLASGRFEAYLKHAAA